MLRTTMILRTVIGMTLAMLVVGCAAASRMGEVVVRQSGDVPCFAIEDTRETRSGDPRLYALYVHTYEGRDGTPIWSFQVALDGPGMPISPDTCVAFGRPPDAAVKSQPTEALRPGVVYLVRMDAAVNQPASPTQGHRAEFCLRRGPDRRIQVHQVQWDKAASKWLREACADNAPVR